MRKAENALKTTFMRKNRGNLTVQRNFEISSADGFLRGFVHKYTLGLLTGVLAFRKT